MATAVKDVPVKVPVNVYDAVKLKHVETQEKQVLPSSEDLKQEKQEKAFRESIKNFEKGELNPSVPAEKVSLPNATAISQEKTLQGIENFDKTQLKHSQTSESSPRNIATQEKAIHDVAGFDKGKLKPTETAEKQALPDSEDISQEKQQVEFRDSIKKYNKADLRHSFTEEKNPLPDATTISHEKTLQNIEGFDMTKLKHTQTAESQSTVLASQEKAMHDIGGFDKSKLKPTDTSEKQVLPDTSAISAEKKEQQFRNSIKVFDKGQLKNSDGSNSSAEKPDALQDIAGFDKTQLKHAKTAESQTSTLFVQEKSMQNIEQFDKTKLKHAETTEKQALPDKEAICQEKQEVEFRDSIEKFPKENLRHSFTAEKIVLPNASTIGHEKAIQNIEGFDKSTLKHTQTAESQGTVLASQEKAILDVGGFDKTKLKRTNTLEKQKLPDTEALTQEKHEETFRKSIEGFPKDMLRHSHTQEKNVLPDATQIGKEKTLQNISQFNKEQLKQVE